VRGPAARVNAMKAQAARFTIGFLTAVLAVSAWLKLGGGWASWIALVVIFVVGSTLAEWTFRKLATPQMIRADLEERVRNPPP
jgi:hypothetical protein